MNIGSIFIISDDGKCFGYSYGPTSEFILTAHGGHIFVFICLYLLLI